MNIKSITTTLAHYKEIITKHAVLIFFLIAVIILGFMLLQIYLLSSVEPSQDQVTEKMSTYKRVQLDKSVVEQFRSLQDKNISIESLFDNGRTNPFE